MGMTAANSNGTQLRIESEKSVALWSRLALSLVLSVASPILVAEGSSWVLAKAPGQTSSPVPPSPKSRKQAPGFWYSPQIVEDRRAPVQGTPIRPVPIPPMFPTPASPGLPSAVQPPSQGGKH
jgi:hypothetical protein